MTDRTQIEPGSPLSLTLFHAWCRIGVAWTLLAVTAPPNSETESSVTCALLHVEPFPDEESNVTTGTFAG